MASDAPNPAARPRGVTVWLTGLSGAGKSTLATLASDALESRGIRSTVLDGDVLRSGLNADLGFAAADRAEAVRRAGEAALIASSAGVVTFAALISPYRADRDRVRARHRACGIGFLEVFVDAPLSVTEARDPKGLYARARAGAIPAFTGISDPYEPPHAPEVRLATAESGAEECARRLAEAVLCAVISPR